jgi:hypothetical protein
MSGNVQFDLGVADSGGEAPASCDVGSIAPIIIPNIGAVCVQPRGGCAAGQIDCSGGVGRDVAIASDGMLGACASNDDCFADCSAHCADSGLVVSAASCTGFCSVSDIACSLDADCLPSGGGCNGPDPVGNNANVCQCTCVGIGGGSGAVGEMQCNLGVDMNIENAAPCDGTDIKIAIGARCLPLTTATATDVIANSNFIAGQQLPANGPITASGASQSCSNLGAGHLTGLTTVGMANFFGSPLGDIAAKIVVQCQ